ncbi:sulfatase-like hydrolase/transferase [Puniceicoccales bacterium CK1056]|uniref:Sulfatase-like hydrolase/transferase n=1 Tax=Oceanipulchritudo coccoides TaxID=2706888 RepID=A0A6B2LZW0_9BACT|nr:sulfatase-like hydrolase/transferase [Oceanipulchritudo coccoides]NDV61589.1 sulfatase-like hydrolase/transferase [Oceanipulchritudo coccoides]
MNFRLSTLGFVLVTMGSLADAMVTVDFSHSYTGVAAVTQNTGQITLDFVVDSVGNVTLDASCADPDPAAYVNEFDGPVGSLPDPAYWSTSFQVIVSGTGNLRIDNSGLGLGIQGQNAQRLDKADEAITFSLQSSNLLLSVSSLNYGNSNGSILDFNGVSFPISGSSGQVDTSSANAAVSVVIDSTSDTDGEGFVLTGISFNLVPQSTDSMEIGTDILLPEEVFMDGSSDTFAFTGSDTGSLTLGKAGKVVTTPSASGASPIAIGQAQLIIEEGARWILDGSQYTGTFNLGQQFILSTFGSFSGPLTGFRHRNFSLPANRNLKLFQTGSSIYYEVVSQTPVTGPNIIVVYMDDMSGGNHFGFEGRDALTPTIDSLASNGVNFTNAITASTVCSPSRYSLLTSRWPTRNTGAEFLQRYPIGTLARFANLGVELPENTDNIGGWLQELGYRTGFVGKSHVVEHDMLATSGWVAGGLMTYSQTIDPAQNALPNAKMAFNHRVIAERHVRRGFDFAGGVYLGNLKEQFNDFLNFHNQEWLTYYARQFIEENHSQPFFLYMAPTINHGPIRSNLSKSLGANPDYTGEGYVPNLDYSFMPSRNSIIQEVTSAGKALVSARETWIDYSMEAIINKLIEHGLLNNTLIIFTSDHGYLTLEDSPVLDGKSSLFESGLKVPLVMHWPDGISSPGRLYNDLVQNVDIAATLLDLAGGSNLPAESINGVSIASVLAGSSAPIRSEAYSEIGYARSIRTLDWKLVSLRYPVSVQQQVDAGFLWNDYSTGLPTHPRPYYIQNTGLSNGPATDYPGYFDDDQLYDLNADPTERINLFGDEPAIQVDLKKRLSLYTGVITGRPFGEFAPIASAAPSAPASFDWTIPSTQTLSLSWADTASNELGFYVSKSVEGSPDEIIAELPVGSFSLSLTLTDYGEDESFQIFAYNAIGDTSSPAPVDLIEPDIWRYRNFYDIDPTLTDPVSDWEGDPDEDGSSTLLEYAFSMDPRNPDFAQPIQPKLVSDPGGTYLRTDIPWDGRSKVVIIGRLSTDLSSWDEGEPFVSLEIDEFDQYFLRSNTPLETENKQFIMYRVALP